jgi:hypothetical protein
MFPFHAGLRVAALCHCWEEYDTMQACMWCQILKQDQKFSGSGEQTARLQWAVLASNVVSAPTVKTAGFARRPKETTAHFLSDR